MRVVRRLNDTFFRVGMDSGFSDSEYRAGTYYFENRYLSFEYLGRKNLFIYGSNGNIDLKMMAQVSLIKPVSHGNDTLFEEVRPSGFEGGWVNLAGMGILVDYTTGHVDPSEGYRIEANLMSSGRLTASDYSFTRLSVSERTFSG